MILATIETCYINQKLPADPAKFTGAKAIIDQWQQNTWWMKVVPYVVKWKDNIILNYFYLLMIGK